MENIERCERRMEMTCMECVHYGRCGVADLEKYPDEEALRADCQFFKNKADFVEVVRCKDCKEYEVRNGVCRLHSFHPVYGEHFEVEMYGNDFCSYGERKEKESV